MTRMRIMHHGRYTHFTYTVPDGNGPFPMVIFSHGYNGCMTDFDQTRKLLNENGIASAALTFSGGSTRDESGFPSVSMTLQTEKEDLLSLIEWARNKEFADKENVFLFGGSMGGLVSCMAAFDVQEKLRGLILMFPALCIVDDWNERFKNADDIPDEMNFWNLTLGKEFFMSMRGMDIYRGLSKITKKTLIFHGDKDPIVPVVYSEKAVKTLQNAELIVFEGEGHGFTSETGKLVDKRTAAFIKSNLKA